MKAKLLTTIVVLLLTPGLLYAKDTKDSDQLNILIDALVVCPPNSATRFVDNGDGTVCDHQTGLMWEMKDASDGAADLTNPRDMDNNYSWSISGGLPDGTAYTDFLARLNGTTANTGPSEQLGGHRDWRLPTSAELQTILDCSFSPCIDPTFGPTAAANYWSSTSFASSQGNASVAAWNANVDFGDVILFSKDNGLRVRAVRGGR